jgi:hypothetical protein
VYLANGDRVPGTYGRNLEFRVAAYNATSADQSPMPTGNDIFEGYQARGFSESSEAPAGFKWQPIWKPYAVETDGNLGLRSITRMSGESEFLLVADRPEMMVTHAENLPTWGVKSVQLKTSTKYGLAFPYVEIELDHSGKKLLSTFTQKYRRHAIAMIVDGQVCLSAMFLTPVDNGVLRISFPPGWQSQAEKLRDAVLSVKD